MKRSKYLQQWYKRWERAARYRSQGLTFDEIGQKMGVTRQRAMQMCKAHQNKISRESAT